MEGHVRCARCQRPANYMFEGTTPLCQQCSEHKPRTAIPDPPKLSDAQKAAELTDEQIEAFARIVDAAEVMGQTFGLTTGMAFRFMAKTARQLARANADGQFNLAAMMTPKGEM